MERGCIGGIGGIGAVSCILYRYIITRYKFHNCLVYDVLWFISYIRVVVKCISVLVEREHM